MSISDYHFGPFLCFKHRPTRVLVWLVLLMRMRSMYKLVRRFRLYDIGKKVSGVSRNMDSVMWDTLKQVVVRSSEVDIKLIL